jgi:serine/threonine-protein kinase ULK/ATG1
LNRKIGAGQYGEVFRGYDRATNNEIAVKSIRRENIKGRKFHNLGKFKELL